MRRKLVLGVGLAALVGGSAAAQFPGGAPPAPVVGGFQPVGPAAPAPALGGFQPVAPAARPAPVAPAAPTGPAPLYSAPPTGAYVPPSDGLGAPMYGSPAPAAPAPNYAPIPVNVEIPSVLGPNHPLVIKPEHGPYFILVKSYVRPAKESDEAKADKGLSARELAEGLAHEIRETYRVQAFLYEYISEERKAEERAKIAARQRFAEYRAQLDTMRQKAELQGMEFLAPDNKLRVMSHRHNDQIGVLVGGFQSEADALKALALVKKWPIPKNDVLCDKGAIARPDASGKSELVTAAINPYASAFVVTNPSIAKAEKPTAPKPGTDPFLVKLNDGRPYNLFKATKGWTLAVKSFTAPVEFVGADTGSKKVGFSKPSDVLAAGAEQAESLAKVIRSMKGPSGQSMNLEAFVLHTRTASIVTVGQYDSADDPALQATKRLLGGLRIDVSDQHAHAMSNVPSLFENMMAMPVPKP
jgi:hypothetical protein